MYEEPEKSLLVALGRVVKKRRLGLHISQEQLAEMAGLHRTYLADVERGSRNLGFINLVRLAEALDMPLCKLVEGIPRPNVATADGVNLIKPLSSRRKG